jgi:orotate phosphoribosyltransferase
MLNKGSKAFLTELHRIGAIKIDTEKGFTLTLHDKNPSAPLSPIYINLRTSKNPKPGPLLASQVETIAHEINRVVDKAHLRFDCIAGIPRAGVPFAEAMHELRKRFRGTTDLIRLQKKGTNSRSLSVSSRHVVRDRDGYRPRVLLIDDLITSATTKWAAIEAARRGGYEVAGIAVYLDREQGGFAMLEKNGIPITAAIKFSEMLQFYQETDIIGQDQMNAINRYLAK